MLHALSRLRHPVAIRAIAGFAWLSAAIVLSAHDAQARGPDPLDLGTISQVTDFPRHSSYIFTDTGEGSVSDEAEVIPNMPLGQALLYAGTEQELTFDQVMGDLSQTSTGYTEGPSILGPVWIRTILTNSSDQNRRWRLDTREAFGPFVRAFLVRQGQPAKLIIDQRWSKKTPAERIPYERLYTSLPIDVPANGKVEVWFDAEFGLPTDTYFRLVDDSRFIHDRQIDASFSNSLFGFRGALLLALLAFALILRDRSALYYSGFHAGLLMVSLAEAAYVLFYLGLTDGASGLVLRLFYAIAFVCYAQTIRHFLNAPRAYPGYDKALRISVLFGLLSVPLLSVFDAQIGLTEHRLYLEGIAVLQFAAIAAFGITLGIRDKLAGASLFLLASLVLVALATIHILGISQILLIYHWQMRHLTNALYAFDGTLFAGALVQRARAIRAERDLAQQGKMQALSDRAELLEQVDDARRDHSEALDLAEQHRRNLAATSHDLKQPLLSLQQSLAKLDDNKSASQGLSYIEGVLRKNLQGTQPAPTNEAETASFELDRTLRNVVLMFEGEAAQKGITARRVASSAKVIAEPIALMRILSNLVSNAINHSGGKRIVIGARRSGDLVDVLVADDGKGFTASEAKTAFIPYAPGKSSRGSGLGLSVASQLAEEAGWTIVLESRPGRGTILRIKGISRAS